MRTTIQPHTNETPKNRKTKNKSITERPLLRSKHQRKKEKSSRTTTFIQNITIFPSRNKKMKKKKTRTFAEPGSEWRQREDYKKLCSQRWETNQELQTPPLSIYSRATSDQKKKISKLLLCSRFDFQMKMKQKKMKIRKARRTGEKREIAWF